MSDDCVLLAHGGGGEMTKRLIDERIVAQARAGGGGNIDSEHEVGGYPTPSPTRATFDPAEWDLETMTRR
jgi:hypothetical protein